MNVPVDPPVRPTLVIDVRLRDPTSGGRSRPVLDGYRPLIRIKGGAPGPLIGLSELRLDGIVAIDVGGSGRAIVMSAPESQALLVDAVKTGDILKLCEGSHVIGEATVLQIL